MSFGIPNSPRRDSRGFQKVVDAFLNCDGLPFAEILSAERIERIFAKHDCLFGLHGIYTTAIMVWSFLSQMLRDGKEASCQAAVARRQLPRVPGARHAHGRHWRLLSSTRQIVRTSPTRTQLRRCGSA
ncbi:MAG: hypothetical protein R3E01_09945 [Pirellulaceae bacterium]|nr:hypothetical protein [Planctomycetales bacterium]